MLNAVTAKVASASDVKGDWIRLRKGNSDVRNERDPFGDHAEKGGLNRLDTEGSTVPMEVQEISPRESGEKSLGYALRTDEYSWIMRTTS
jgi:hypothetical protein